MPALRQGEGCRIYAERPADCRSFLCLWKVVPDLPDEPRPGRCKVMWTTTEDGTTAIATTEYPNALATGAQRSSAEQFRAAGVQVRIAALPR